MRRHRVFALMLVWTCAAPCLWDSDTIDDELRGLPDALQLITGRWYRHGEAYYRARIEQLAPLAAPSFDQLDDLAVAHEKLGDHAAAIAVMQRKRAALDAHPDREHEYRYRANLGTFLAHSGRYQEALTELQRAVAINPDAHFGRERFQIELIGYVAAAQQQPQLWRRGPFAERLTGDFTRMLQDPEGGHAPEPLDWDAAYAGLAGMVRFGGREGAELYRSLGDLFLDRQHLNLAWWSWQRAIERGHPAAAELRRLQQSLEHQWQEAAANLDQANVIPTEELYRRVRANADAWLTVFQTEEGAAIARGEDAGATAVLQRLLATADARVPAIDLGPSWWARTSVMTRVRAALALSLLVCLGLWLWQRTSQRHAIRS